MVDVVNEAQSLNGYWFEGLRARSFDIAFIRAGIVGCCPRLVPRRFYGYARRAPGFRRLEKSPRVHRLLARPWTSASRFSNALSGLVKILPNISKISFFIDIARPANYRIENVGDFPMSWFPANEMLRELAAPTSLVQWQTSNSGEIHLHPDGYHLTALGHQAVAKACLDRYQEVI